MMNEHPDSGLPIGIHKISHGDFSHGAIENSSLSKIFQTREVREALSKILPDILKAFIKDSRSSKFMEKRLVNIIDKLLSRPDDIIKADELALLLKDKSFVSELSLPLPEMLNGFFDIIISAVKNTSDLPTGEKTKAFEELASKVSKGQTADLLTQVCIIINDIHKADPVFFTKLLAPGFKKWIETIDYGEIRELFDTSAEDGRNFIEMVNNTLWQYPTKMIMILSFMPSLLNFIGDALEISLDKINELPPDLLSDVIVSLVTEINVEPIAKTINQLTEVIRKIHTGSALLGDPGTPELPKILFEMIERIIEKTDPVTFWKAKIALAEITTSIDEAITDAAFQNDAFRNLGMIKGPEITNTGLKSLNKKLSSWENVDDKDMAKSFGQHLAAYNVQEMGEVLNNTLIIINRLKDENPEIFSEIIGQLVNSIDTYELEQTAKHLFNEVGTQVQPVARAVVPGLITWMCDVIKPCDDEFEGEAQKARQALQSLFASQED